ncbi:10438_t:CDS:2 [Acaulospora morrowiae]|uniref:10438_t:CDS:1 n=1 Tax=Acaulospora morrowiae TaxID=94023 RepID=A0A9N8ZY19_9GLOM|nr:10438_t:CDS:2 [Acaulospora morrowiae]
MSQPTSDECKIPIYDEISNDQETLHVESNNNPHNGKKIDKVVFSPKMGYVATASFEHRSVCMWKFNQEKNGELKLELYHSFDLGDTVLGAPICVSDFGKILTGNFYKGSYIYEIRDRMSDKIVEKLLDGKDHENALVTCGFLTNGRFAVVERDPYQVHIFSKVGGQWHGTRNVKLVKFKNAAISQDRVLILIELPFVIMQWNLITRKFEKQYELDWSLAEYRKGILMELSNDQQILAVAGRLNTKQEGDSDTKQEGDSDAKQEGDSDAKQEGDSNKKQEGDSNTKQEENSRVYFYSTQSGTIIGNQSFEEKFYEKKKIIKKIQKSGKKFDKKSISRIRFIKFEKEEFLFIYFGQEKKSYAITPPTSSSSLNLHSLPNSPSTLKNSGELPLLAEINFILRYHNDQSFNNKIRKYQDDLNSFGEEKWKEDSRDENGVGSQREYIKKRIDDILENYRSKQMLAKQSSFHRSLGQDSVLPEPLDGKRYTWTVQNASHDNILVAGITARWTATNVEIGKISVEELAKYVKMLEDDENEEISQPRVSNAVRKVIERKKKLEGVI